MFSKSSRLKKPYPTLYHLSFNSNLEGVWSPQLPDGEYGAVSDPNLHPEPDTARISLSPTLEGCFQAVYANVKHLFKNSPDRTLEFSVYKAQFKGNERIVTPDKLSKYRMVHDAHITLEHCVLDPLKMVHVGKVIVCEPKDKDRLDYHAFGVPKSDIYGWLPHPVRFKSVSVEQSRPPSSNW